MSRQTLSPEMTTNKIAYSQSISKIEISRIAKNVNKPTSSQLFSDQSVTSSSQNVDFKITFKDHKQLTLNTVHQRRIHFLSNKFTKTETKPPVVNLLGWNLYDEEAIKSKPDIGKQLNSYADRYKKEPFIECSSNNSTNSNLVHFALIELIGKKTNQFQVNKAYEAKYRDLMKKESIISKELTNQLNKISDSYSISKKHNKDLVFSPFKQLNPATKQIDKETIKPTSKDSLSINKDPIDLTKFDKKLIEFATLLINIFIKLNLYNQKKIVEFQRKYECLSRNDQSYLKYINDLSIKNDLITKFLNNFNYSNFLNDSDLSIDELNTNNHFKSIYDSLNAQSNSIISDEKTKCVFNSNLNNWLDYFDFTKVFYKHFIRLLVLDEAKCVPYFFNVSNEFKLFIFDLINILDLKTLLEDVYISTFLKPLNIVLDKECSNLDQIDPRRLKKSYGINLSNDLIHLEWTHKTNKNEKIKTKHSIEKKRLKETKLKYKKQIDQLKLNEIDQTETEKILADLFNKNQQSVSSLKHGLLSTPKSSPNDVFFIPSQHDAQFYNQKEDNAQFVQLEQFDYNHNNDHTMITSNTDQLNIASKCELLNQSLDLMDLEDWINIDFTTFSTDTIRTNDQNEIQDVFSNYNIKPIHSEIVQNDLMQKKPVHAEPIQTDTIHLEIFQDEPVHSEMVQNEPIQNLQVHTEPVRLEIVHTESIHSKIAQHEPKHIEIFQAAEPIQVETKQIESIQSETVQGEFIHSEIIHFEPIRLEIVQTEPVHSEIVQYKPKNIVIVQNEPTQNAPVHTESIHPEIAQGEPIQNEPVHSFKNSCNFSNLSNNQKSIIKLTRKNELINDSSLNDSNKIIDCFKSPVIELRNDIEKQLSHKDALKEQKLINNSSLFDSISQNTQKNDKLENSSNILKNKVTQKQDSSNDKSSSLKDIKKSLKESFFYLNDKFKNLTQVERNQTEITAIEDEKFCLDVDDEPEAENKIMEDLRQLLTPDQSSSKLADNLIFSTPIKVLNKNEIKDKEPVVQKKCIKRILYSNHQIKSPVSKEAILSPNFNEFKRNIRHQATTSTPKHVKNDSSSDNEEFYGKICRRIIRRNINENY